MTRDEFVVLLYEVEEHGRVECVERELPSAAILAEYDRLVAERDEARCSLDLMRDEAKRNADAATHYRAKLARAQAALRAIADGWVP